MTLFEYVKDLAGKQGKSIRAIEIAAGVGTGTVQKWQNHSPRLENIKKVAKALGVPEDELFKVALEEAIA